MKSFFTADTHFGNERTMKMSLRPFKNTRQMDKAMIKNWNKIVGKNDTVYHLGDFGNYQVVQKLNGKIVLLFGNYERKDMVKFGNSFENMQKYLIDLGFAEVHEKSFVVNLSHIGEPMQLNHEPLNCNPNMFNLFGHVHKLCLVKTFGLNVGTDNYHYFPATVKQVLFLKDAIKNHYDEQVFCTVEQLKNNEE